MQDYNTIIGAIQMRLNKCPNLINKQPVRFDVTLTRAFIAVSYTHLNAHNFGFILRYPQGKQEITGTSYEPWHYRYVGVDAAREIYERGI